MFWTFIGVIWTIDHLIANEGSRYTSWTIVAFPVTLLTSVDRGLAYDSNSLFRLTIMNSPSRNENINNLAVSFSGIAILNNMYKSIVSIRRYNKQCIKINFYPLKSHSRSVVSFPRHFN